MKKNRAYYQKLFQDYPDLVTQAQLRKMRGMSQEQLAEKASISRSHLSAIEAPNMVRAFSMEAFFNIADALDVTPEELIQIAFLQDKILKRKS